MKSLREALLNRPKNIDVTSIAAEEYINTNYIIKGKLTFETVNGVYIVNCDGHVEVKNKKIKKLTEGFEWGIVTGSFDCFECENLESLKGTPKEAWDFNCACCHSLKSLEGGPENVGSGGFYCDECNLESLEGAPEKVKGDFYCKDCPNLKTLEGSPKEVGGDFECKRCKNLTSLKGAPKTVGGIFNCSECKNLTSLKGAPEKVRSGVFACYGCVKLESLEGAPKNSRIECDDEVKKIIIPLQRV